MGNKKFHKEFEKKIANILRINGFTGSGNTYYLFKNDSCGVIMIQNAKTETLGCFKFTLNFGVSLNVIRQFYESARKEPEFDECQWKIRIGQFMEERNDVWWIIENESDVFDIITDFEVRLKLLLPQFLIKISEGVLKEEWLKGKATGITEFERLQYLTILLKKDKSPDLEKAVNELVVYSKGKSFEYSARVHLNELKEV